MSGSTEAWALFTAKTSSATERVVLFRASSATNEETGDGVFDLDDLISYSGESEGVVRQALNGLVRKGYLAQIEPDGDRSFKCKVQFDLDEEYVF